LSCARAPCIGRLSSAASAMAQIELRSVMSSSPWSIR
jgi:hypothetical protein